MKVVLALAFVLHALVVSAQWAPPAGVPVPSFGISEVAPLPTLYVNEATGSDSFPGTVGLPKRSIPRQLAAGTIVNVVGTQTTTYSSPNTITANGTLSQPVFIVGGTYTGSNQLVGSYVILQTASNRGGWYVNGHHIVFRDSEFSGGGIAIVQWLGTGSPNNIVVLRDTFHDIGTPPASWPTGGDDDAHGVGVGHHASYIWILDSTFLRVSGDGVQVNGESFGALTHHIYMGRNVCQQNRQSCGWAKQSADVTFSQNTATQMRSVDAAGNPGQGFGAQYQALRVVFIKNEVSDSDYGIRIGSDSDGPFGVLVAGNNLHNIHNAANSSANPQSRGGAIVFTNNGNRVVVGNSLSDVDTGVGVANSGGAVAIVRNTFWKTKKAVVYETPIPSFLGNTFDVPQSLPADVALDLGPIAAAYQASHGVPLGVDLGSPVITPPPPPPPPSLPPCSSLSGWAWLLAKLFGRCI